MNTQVIKLREYKTINMNKNKRRLFYNDSVSQVKKKETITEARIVNSTFLMLFK